MAAVENVLSFQGAAGPPTPGISSGQLLTEPLFVPSVAEPSGRNFVPSLTCNTDLYLSLSLVTALILDA